MKRLTAILFALVLLVPPALAQEATQQEPAKPAPGADKAPDRAQLEKTFAETMSGAALVGHFSMSGRGGEPKEERYTLRRVTKQQGDYWLFLARIQYGGHDVTLPMLLPVKWAGDTAVITVTNVGFPGLGTYTARVLIHGDQYAGTWSGGDHGGHLWGRIERAGDAPKPEKGAADQGRTDGGAKRNEADPEQ